MKAYGHLTYQERDRIALLRSAGLCPAAIAREIGRPGCTVGRELKRNCNGDGAYRPVSSEGRYFARRQRRRILDANPELARFVAGKGFAVVASEVKSLANQTAGATEEISAQISEIQGATKAAVDANSIIAKTINEIHEVATAIASAVEEQGAATQEVSSNIVQVSEASDSAGQAANQVLEASSELAEKSAKLQGYLDQFMKNMGAT